MDTVLILLHLYRDERVYTIVVRQVTISSDKTILHVVNGRTRLLKDYFQNLFCILNLVVVIVVVVVDDANGKTESFLLIS